MKKTIIKIFMGEDEFNMEIPLNEYLDKGRIEILLGNLYADLAHGYPDGTQPEIRFPADFPDRDILG